MYSKPYTKRINDLRMPVGYQPPKFQQFDKKDNPKQHIAHFVKTCENAGSRGDQLVKQFVQSLKGNAFEWYTDLEPEVIDSWEQLKTMFLNCFYSTGRVISMMELTNTKQWKGDRGAKDFLVPKIRSDKNEINETKKITNSVINESMVVQETTLKSFSKRKETKVERKHDGDEKRCPTLRERQEKVDQFLDFDVADMLEKLLEKQLIQLPECKRPEQVEKVDDPNYCKYHWIISHPVENKIELDIDEIVQSNHVVVEMTSSVPPLTQFYD
ncbi:retrotransposon gag protein [Cucumis melo var. makuwa]|uniref:Retrotransposon gag protein n=1 Tax=Cucumis melo var. makuwa TaxID=1194695 RepID=A0A5D3BQ21_CUCMM|nr:retrotransposon gag protein [Cucumis melo var. makuwa]